MTQVGLIPSQVLASLDQDSQGQWLNVPEGQSVVPLIKEPRPADAPGFVWVPNLVWTEQAVTRTWVQHAAMPPSPAEAMTAARSAMADILDALDMDDRMKLQPLRVQVEAALNLGQVDLAHYIVTNATVEAHLLPVRAQILALFPQS